MGRDRSSHASPRQHYRPGTARHRGVSKVRKVKAHSSGRTKLLLKRVRRSHLRRFACGRLTVPNSKERLLCHIKSLPRKRFGVANCGATFPAANSVGIKMKIIK